MNHLHITCTPEMCKSVLTMQVHIRMCACTHTLFCDLPNISMLSDVESFSSSSDIMTNFIDSPG